MKLSKAQERVMKWADGGWTLHCVYGAVVHVNGQKVCNLDRIMALVRMGVLVQSDRWAWKKHKIKEKME